MPWTRGSASGLTNYLITAETKYRDEALVAMEQAVVLGEEQMKANIKAAVTATGEARAGTGQGEPGRIETSDMYDAVSHDVKVTLNRISGKFGWIDGFEDYFLYQEHGTENGHVPAMDALLAAFLTASEELYGSMAEITR